MDEPLSALDQMTKEEILPYFEALRTSSSLPALYVSHDISEIERLADNLVLLDSGRVLAARTAQRGAGDFRLPIARSPQASTVLEARVGRYGCRGRPHRARYRRRAGAGAAAHGHRKAAQTACASPPSTSASPSSARR